MQALPKRQRQYDVVYPNVETLRAFNQYAVDLETVGIKPRRFSNNERSAQPYTLQRSGPHFQ